MIPDETPMDLAALKSLQDRLEHHPVYGAVRALPSLRIFMEHHVYSVWDFMSLLKALQRHAAPTEAPWLPGGRGSLQRFINEIVWQEESDEVTSENGSRYLSHFEMYVEAMREVGADTSSINAFIEHVRKNGVQPALNSGIAPKPAVDFMSSTFAVLDADQPHTVAAAFALGREQVIPRMFRTLLDEMGLGSGEAQMFHYYLQRHMELDGESHGPMAEQMLQEICDSQAEKEREAVAAAEEALESRIAFWDQLEEQIQVGK